MICIFTFVFFSNNSTLFLGFPYVSLFSLSNVVNQFKYATTVPYLLKNRVAPFSFWPFYYIFLYMYHRGSFLKDKLES